MSVFLGSRGNSLTATAAVVNESCLSVTHCEVTNGFVCSSNESFWRMSKYCLLAKTTHGETTTKLDEGSADQVILTPTEK